MAMNSCPYCGQLIRCNVEAHLDHMDPRSKGGWDHPDNLLEVCRKCNLKKGDLLFEQWLHLLKEPQKKKARDIYVEKHCYSPDDFVPAPSVIRFGNPGGSHTSPELEARIGDLELKKAQGTLTQREVLEVTRSLLEELRASPSSPCEQLPDERGLCWESFYYQPDDTPDENWWFRERMFGYSRIPRE